MAPQAAPPNAPPNAVPMIVAAKRKIININYKHIYRKSLNKSRGVYFLRKVFKKASI